VDDRPAGLTVRAGTRAERTIGRHPVNDPEVVGRDMNGVTGECGTAVGNQGVPPPYRADSAAGYAAVRW
jgi:hypothetical protein